VDVHRSPKHRSITVSNRNYKVKGLTNKTQEICAIHKYYNS
jgi:hypothetical protein